MDPRHDSHRGGSRPAASSSSSTAVPNATVIGSAKRVPEESLSPMPKRSRRSDLDGVGDEGVALLSPAGVAAVRSIEHGEDEVQQTPTRCAMPLLREVGVVIDERSSVEVDLGEEEDTEDCPVVDKSVKPFRLMDLPAEIRIEIYRACLTRPFDILLSRTPHTPAAEEKEGDDDDGRDADYNGVASDHNAGPYNRGNPSNGPGQPASPRSRHPLGRVHRWASRGTRHLSLRSQTPQPQPGGTPTSFPPDYHPLALADVNIIPHNQPSTRTRRSYISSASSTPTPGASSTNPEAKREPRPQDIDPLLTCILRANKLVYKEARPILYGENTFILDLDTALPTLAALHQRSRGQIRHIALTIPTHNEILERFAEVVRLSLRYCWKLQKCVINMPFVLPGADGSGTSGNTTVYANAFDILRWLPRQCEVVLEGNVCEEIRAVVDKNANLAKNLDELAYARRQLISNDADRPHSSEE